MNEIIDRTYVGIGREYGRAFRSIYDLIYKKCVSFPGVSCEGDDTILTPNYRFQFIDAVSAMHASEQIGMSETGSSWFMCFRGGDTDNTMSAWFDFVEAVAASYHREYSFVEYVQDNTSRSEEEVAQCRARVERVLERLKLKLKKNVSRFADAAPEDSVEDIYSVTLRMEIVLSGTGEPTPVLGKVFFRHKNGAFTPVRKGEAQKTELFINSVIEKQTGYERPHTSDSAGESEMVDKVLYSIEHLITGRMEIGFTDSILIANGVDEENIQALIEGETGDEIEIECKKLRVLGISHIKWIDTAFDIYVDGQKTFIAKISPNGSMSWYCRCNSENSTLIEGDVISCIDADTHIPYEVVLDTTKDDLGITDDALIDKILSESAIAKHAMEISCPELARRNIQCRQHRCECNTIMLADTKGVQRRRCADCPYPEILLRDGNGEVACTASLNFDTRTLRPVAEKTVACQFCGRHYVTARMTGDFECDFCREAIRSCEDGTVDPRAHVTYKKYAGMLPLSARIGAKGKYCFENEDRLLFVVGKNKYFFDKLKINDTGMLEKPEKRQ
jgi:hypothetical protein